MRKILILLFAFGLLLAGRPGLAQPGEEDYAQMVEAALEGYLRPALDAFEERARGLQEAATLLCAEPSEDHLEAAREAFGKAALAYAAVEYIDLNPWLEENRGARIYFFPDRRGVTGRHLRRALADKDPALLEGDAILQYSVALQGLPALEYLLYAKGYRDLAQTGVGQYRCRLTVAVADNLLRLAGDLRAAWAHGSAYDKEIGEPQPSNELVRSHKEAATLLLGRLATGLEAMIQRKVSAPLGASLEEARPLRAAYSESGLSNAALIANLEGLQALQEAAAIPAQLETLAPETAAALGPAFEKASADIAALPLPIGEAGADPATRAEVEALQADLLALHRLAGQEALAGLGLKVFFSADDGD